MNDKALLTTGVVGTVLAALCCFTPVLVVLLAGVGLSVAIGYLDCVPSKALIGALSRCVMPQLRSASTVSKRPHASPSGKPLFGKNRH